MSNDKLEQNVTDELFWDPKVDSVAIAVSADDGAVTLRGTVGSFRQKREASQDAARVYGVKRVDNEIVLVAPTPSAVDVKHSIKKALERNAKLDADELFVESKNGTITVSGTVSSWLEHDEAVSAAWAAPGVTRVDDRIDVDY